MKFMVRWETEDGVTPEVSFTYWTRDVRHAAVRAMEDVMKLRPGVTLTIKAKEE